MESAQASLNAKVSTIRRDTSEIKTIMAEIFQAFKGSSTSASVTPTLALTQAPATVEGENVTDAPHTEAQHEAGPSHTEGEHYTEATPLSYVQPQEQPTS